MTFIKGQSGNPKGRPKGPSITEEIRKALFKKPPGDDKKTYMELIILRIFHKAIKDGDVTMLKAIWNYIDGMPKQDHNLSGDLLVKIQQYGKQDKLNGD